MLQHPWAASPPPTNMRGEGRYPLACMSIRLRTVHQPGRLALETPCALRAFACFVYLACRRANTVSASIDGPLSIPSCTSRRNSVGLSFPLLAPPLPLRPVESLVEPAFEAVEQFVDLRFADDQRRTERDAVAEQGARDDAFLFREFADLSPRPFRRLETRLASSCRPRVSMPPIRPTPLASPTSGCSPSFARRARKRGATSRTWPTMSRC